MKVKRMAKRLFAVSAGATMLGATVMGAMAASNLSNYPSMFVENGQFNGYFVLGKSGKTIDNAAALDIATSMKYVKGSGSGTVTVEGDAWMVGTSAKFLELANNNASDSSVVGEQISDVASFVDKDDLAALASGTWSTRSSDYDYNQYLFFDDTVATSNIVKHSENDDDTQADFFYITKSQGIARYKLELTSAAQSDVTDSAGTASSTGLYLDDFENTELSIMGTVYSIVQARRTTTAGANIKLILMAGSQRDTLTEGETKSYTINGKTYDVKISYVDTDEAKFIINGEETQKIKDGDTYVLSDKTEVGVSEVLYQDYLGGIHSATFFLGAKKMELKDTDVTNSTGTEQLKIGSNDEIDGTTVIITGSDNNSTFTINTIEINMSAEDDYFVGANKKLSDIISATGEEKDVLLGGAFDIEYKGLTTETSHDLMLKTSSSRRYKLRLFDGDNKAVDIPVAYAETSGYNVSMGEEARDGTARANWKALILNETSSIYKDDYFVLTGGSASDGSAKSYLLQYKSADGSTKTSPKIKFKNLGDGTNMEYSVTQLTQGTGTVATLKLGGYSFLVQNASVISSDDFQVNVALNGDSDVTDGNDGTLIAFVDSYGSQFAIVPTIGNSTSTGPSSVLITQTTPNGDDYDNQIPATVTLNLTQTTDPEVRADIAGLTLLTPSGETDVKYGYTSMGAYYKFNEPSSDPDELTITYPQQQRLPQLYVTTKATSSVSAGSGKTSGQLATVEVVNAVKFDDEISDYKAQNLIVVGGPCVNTVSAQLMGNPSNCAEGFTPGKALVKLYDTGSGKMAMLVAGYSGDDTRLAGRVIANRWTELTGMEVEVEGTTYSDAKIGAPTKVEVTVEKQAEPTTELTTQ